MTARNIGMSRARSIIVRSTSSTIGSNSTIFRVESDCTIEGREMADAEHPMRRDRLQIEFDLIEKGEGAFRADQQLCHIVAATGAVAINRINIVAAHPPQHLRKSPGDLVSFAAVQGAHLLHEVAIALGHRIAIAIGRQIAGDLAEPGAGSVGEQRVDSAHIMDHLPYRIERAPQLLLPAMPPIVGGSLLTDRPGRTAYAAAARDSSQSSTTPGSTRARLPSTSTETIRSRCFEQSMTSARATVWPHCEVPAPRANTGASSSRAIAIAAAASRECAV